MNCRLAYFAAALAVLICMPIAPAQTADGFAQAASLHQGRFGHTATLLASGKVLVAGGATLDDILASAELYDPSRNTWAATGALTTARTYATATVLPSGKVLVAGGVDGPDPLASAEIYDPATGVWSTAGSMGTPRAHHTATLLDSGNVMIAFGTSGTNGANKLSTTAIYDPATNGWTTGPAAPNARAYHSAEKLENGWVLVNGGIDSTGTARADGLVYIPASGSWAGPVGVLATARFAFATVRLPSDKVLASGGIAPATLATAESFDNTTNHWTPAGTMSTARWSHTLTVLPSGLALAVAGVDGNDDALASAETFDPAANAWTPTAHGLAVARAQHTATLLDSGKVLIVGGQGAAPGYDALASSELYALDPVFHNGFDRPPVQRADDE